MQKRISLFAFTEWVKKCIQKGRKLLMLSASIVILGSLDRYAFFSLRSWLNMMFIVVFSGPDA